MILKEEKINLGRQLEIDFVKAFAIIFMVIIHVYEEISYAELEILPNTFLDNAIQFLGGPLAAPIFMFSLGLGMSYSKHRSPKELIERGIKLFIFSYVLNIIRFLIPYLIYSVNNGFKPVYLIYETFQIDILTFAGMAFIMTGLLKKLNVPVFGMVIIALALQATGTVITNNVVFTTRPAIYILGIFVKTGEPSYFPFFQWYIYPMIGLLFAKYLRHIEATDKLYLTILAISSSALISLCVALYAFGLDIRTLYTVAFDLYYYQNFIYFLFCICCVNIEIALVHFIIKVLKIKEMPAWVKFMSNKLNEIYIVQWIIIGWLNGVALGYEPFVPVNLCIPAGILILVISIIIVKVYSNYQLRQKAQ